VRLQLNSLIDEASHLTSHKGLIVCAGSCCKRMFGDCDIDVAIASSYFTVLLLWLQLAQNEERSAWGAAIVYLGQVAGVSMLI